MRDRTSLSRSRPPGMYTACCLSGESEVTLPKSLQRYLLRTAPSSGHGKGGGAAHTQAEWSQQQHVAATSAPPDTACQESGFENRESRAWAHPAPGLLGVNSTQLQPDATVHLVCTAHERRQGPAGLIRQTAVRYTAPYGIQRPGEQSTLS